MTARAFALKLLLDYESCGKYVNLSLNHPAFLAMSADDRAFVTSLLYTTVERKITLDYLIGVFSGRTAASLSDHTRAVLRLGICQVLYLSRVPDFAAVSETVKLAGNAGERGFVNAVLRRTVRERERLPFPARERNPARYLSVVYSFPLPVVRHFLSEYGAETEDFLAAFNCPRPLSLTVNTDKISVSDFVARLTECGLAAAPSALLPSRGVTVTTPVAVRDIPGFSDGLFFVQDGSGLLHGDVLDARAADTTVDVCAAPGGKSFGAAFRMHDRGAVYAFDIHESKLSLIEDGARRLGLSSVRAAVRDAREPDETLSGAADRVICDVPCSGLGVLGGKPDLRYKDPAVWETLPALGLSILSASAAYVRPGGTLLYSTCTLAKRENRDVVDAFLAEHGDFSLSPFTVGTKMGADGTLTLLPHKDGTDGFYMAKLIRT